MGAGDRPASEASSPPSGRLAVGAVLSLVLAGDGRTECDETAPEPDPNTESGPLPAHRRRGAFDSEGVVEKTVETVVDWLMKVVEMSLNHGPFGGRAEGFRDPGPIHGFPPLSDIAIVRLLYRRLTLGPRNRPPRQAAVPAV